MKCFDSKLSFSLLNDIYIELDLLQPRSKVTISHRVSCSPYKLQRLNRIESHLLVAVVTKEHVIIASG